MKFTQTFQRQIDVAPAGHVEATYRYDPALPKACLHPIVTPGGATITGFEMSDHVWHRGLWFTVKFVNGTNFWEEHAPFGTQKPAREPRAEYLADGALRITDDIEWASDATGPAIRETRTMTFRATGEARVIDFATSLVAQQDLTLDRTPYTTWGGYGGLSFRGSRELHDADFELPNGERVKGIAGQRHEQIVMRAKVDGGANRTIAMGIVDHPGNDVEPTPWYAKEGNGGFTYWNAAFLFHGPLTLAKGAALNKRYRIVYRDGDFADGEFKALADAFRAEGTR